MTATAEAPILVKFTSINGARESVTNYIGKAQVLLDVAREQKMEIIGDGVLRGICANAVSQLMFVRDIFYRMCNQGVRSGDTDAAMSPMVDITNCTATDMQKTYAQEFAFVLGAINSPFLYTDMPEYRSFQQAAAGNLRAALAVLDARIAFMQGQR